MDNPITQALKGLSVDQEMQLYLKVGQAMVADLRVAEQSAMEAERQRRQHEPGIRREAITRFERGLFDVAIEAVTKDPPDIKHHYNCEMIDMTPYREYMQEVARLEEV